MLAIRDFMSVQTSQTAVDHFLGFITCFKYVLQNYLNEIISKLCFKTKAQHK